MPRVLDPRFPTLSLNVSSKNTLLIDQIGLAEKYNQCISENSDPLQNI